MLRTLGDLASPVSCAGCDLRGAALCSGCRAALRRIGRGAARCVGTPSAPGAPPTWALTDYDGVLRRVVVAHKDDGRIGLLPELSRLWRVALAGTVRAEPGLRRALAERDLAVVPVPSRAASVRERGRDPWAEVVTDALHGEERLPVRRALTVHPRVRDQAGLDAGARATNLHGAMAVRRRVDVAGRRWLVADDVVTTGATLAEAARALRCAGAAQVWCVVIAATVLRAPPRRDDRAGDQC